MAATEASPHASRGEVTDLHLQRADTHGQGHRHDGDVARQSQIHLGLHQGLETDGGNGSEQQQHDAAHHRHRDGGEQGVELAKEGQNDGEHRGPVMVTGLKLRVIITAPVTSA